jgi:hypothetical protein
LISKEEVEIPKDIHAKIKNSIMLYHPNLNKEFNMYTDASHIGLGSVLTQENNVVVYLATN